MTPAKVKMTCEDVDKKLKNFLGDLLSDDDYQGFVEHLDGCAKCGNRVRSMGSFTNQLWELGDIEVPSDLDSTILFQYEKTKKEPRKTTSKKPKKWVIAAIVLAVGGAAFGAKTFFKSPELNTELAVDDAVIVQATSFKKKEAPRDPEAERLYNQLKDMAESLAPAKPAIPKKKASVKKESKKKVTQRKAAAAPRKEPVASFSDAYALHWHVPFFTESDVKKLVGTLNW